MSGLPPHWVNGLLFYVAYNNDKEKEFDPLKMIPAVSAGQLLKKEWKMKHIYGFAELGHYLS
ncbi:MAG: hypothetical protein ABIR15_02300 [Chitinophagaceae bacterium]